MVNIDYLFELFLEVWDEAWGRKIIDNAAGKKRQWAESLAGRTRNELIDAHNIARTMYNQPPTIKEFVDLCKQSGQVQQEYFTFNDAANYANEKIIKKLIIKNSSDVDRERKIFTDLSAEIYRTKNINCDFAICSVESCPHYEIFDRPNLISWICIKHRNNHE